MKGANRAGPMAAGSIRICEYFENIGAGMLFRIYIGITVSVASMYPGFLAVEQWLKTPW